MEAVYEARLEQWGTMYTSRFARRSATAFPELPSWIPGHQQTLEWLRDEGHIMMCIKSGIEVQERYQATTLISQAWVAERKAKCATSERCSLGARADNAAA